MKRLIVVFLSLAFLFGSVNSAAAFSDVVSFKEEIQRLTELGIINGYDDGTFRPNNNITRVQTVQMIVREMGIEEIESHPDFKDVKQGSNGYKDIAFAVEKGFISGFSDGTFKPNEKLTRAQMAKILVKAYNLNAKSTYRFKDVIKGYWAEEFISAMASTGVTYGYADDTFRPNEFVTRGQFSAFLARVLDLKEKAEVPGQEPTNPGEEPQQPGDPAEEPTNPTDPGKEPEDPGVPGEEPGSVEGTLIYKGKTNVRSSFADNQMIENLHHYVADLGEGHPINIYVTDDYDKRFGKGYSYDETIQIVRSIDSYRKAKPYTKKLGTLNIFFYTNESNTKLPTYPQAVIGSWATNNGDGIPSEMLINGSNMPYDFRTSYVHEFVHYFDYQSFISEYQNTFYRYWGDDYRFWLLEGGAEYGSYYFYQYPENTKNNLWKNFVKNDRDSIIEYAKNQGGHKKNLLYDLELNSFDDINRAGSNNYGITLSLFWYLVEQYGYKEVYDYVRYVGETYEGVPVISQSQKEQTARKFFGKTEEEVLKDWLEYFNYFDGELQEFKETETATANYVLEQGNPLLHPEFSGQLGTMGNGNYTFALNVSEWIPEMGDAQAESFRANATFEFTLVADGYEKVNLNRNYAFYTGTLNNGERLYAFGFEIPASEQAKLVKGVKYKIVPHNNDTKYQWVIPDDITFGW